jgi:hypothetical protein
MGAAPDRETVVQGEQMSNRRATRQHLVEVDRRRPRAHVAGVERDPAPEITSIAELALRELQHLPAQLDSNNGHFWRGFSQRDGQPSTAACQLEHPARLQAHDECPVELDVALVAFVLEVVVFGAAIDGVSHWPPPVGSCQKARCGPG